MWSLRLAFVLLLLPAVSGCVFCRRPDRNLKKRFEKLCAAYKRVKRSASCSRHPGPRSFQPYGLGERRRPPSWLCVMSLTSPLSSPEEDAMLFITEKTHRVFRALEITRDPLGIAAYWDWLHEEKLLLYTKEVLCPPACDKKTLAMNCSLCRLRWMPCLPQHICYPGSRSAALIVRLVLCCSLVSLPVGLLLCSWEYRRYRSRRPPEPH
ncbi:sperm-egg fusion protein TMEM95 isoform X1 [Eleutherodactylus coqui]|uniref:sperm-egg fusion protein TMEM95 isoform X1 n=1 Tax=Eleutherodactylus coqui TaxID=57060 RepID=UPI0034629756